MGNYFYFVYNYFRYIWLRKKLCGVVIGWRIWYIYFLKENNNFIELMGIMLF